MNGIEWDGPIVRELLILLAATLTANMRASVCKWVPRSCRHGVGGVR